MKFFTKSQKTVGQNSQKLRKPQKHDANLRKNSSLYFQIGLILCLLGTYGLFEMKFENFKTTSVPSDPWDDPVIQIMPEVVVEPRVVAMADPEPKPKTQKLTTLEPIIEKNTSKVTETVIDVKPTIEVPVIKVKVRPKPTAPKKPDNRSYNMGDLEVVPIYPGCEKEDNNDDRIKCMSKKLNRLIQNRFDTSLGSEYGLSGVQKITVQFKIDQLGNITDIKTRAPHKILEDEAVRLANKIPSMEPGKQASQPVSVIYNLPIKFSIND